MIYPKIDAPYLTNFRALRLMLLKDPEVLDKPECPYSQEVKNFLRDVFKPAPPVREVRRYEDDDLYAEICDLYDRVKVSIDTMGTVEAKEKSQILKNATELLTKLVTLREKQSSVREMARFQRIVIDVLEGVLTPAQRSEFLERLGDLANV